MTQFDEIAAFGPDVTSDQVSSVLEAAKTVWILKSEDYRLSQAGLSSNRPQGARAAYTSVGIDIVSIGPFID